MTTKTTNLTPFLYFCFLSPSLPPSLSVCLSFPSSSFSSPPPLYLPPSLPSSSYSPGDVLMIMPENVPEAVDRFLEVTRLTPFADSCISIAPNESKREGK